MDYVLDQEQLNSIEEILQKDLIDMGVQCAVFIDLAGNIIVELETGDIKHDIHSLAALAAGNFGAVSAMAEIIGEEEFSLLFHKGEKENVHFSKVIKNFLLITIFSHETSLGLLRLKAAEAVEKLEKLMSSLSK